MLFVLLCISPYCYAWSQMCSKRCTAGNVQDAAEEAESRWSAQPSIKARAHGREQFMQQPRSGAIALASVSSDASLFRSVLLACVREADLRASSARRNSPPSAKTLNRYRFARLSCLRPTSTSHRTAPTQYAGHTETKRLASPRGRRRVIKAQIR